LLRAGGKRPAGGRGCKTNACNEFTTSHVCLASIAGIGAGEPTPTEIFRISTISRNLGHNERIIALEKIKARAPQQSAAFELTHPRRKTLPAGVAVSPTL
jgi:hypothetical protein